MSFPDQKSTIAAQPLIAVRNVRASSRWYVELLGADAIPEHPHRDVYDRISHSGRLLLQLHAWDAEDHPNLVNADAAPPGHGVLLWFPQSTRRTASSERKHAFPSFLHRSAASKRSLLMGPCRQRALLQVLAFPLSSVRCPKQA